MSRSHELGCGRRRLELDASPSPRKAFELPGARPSYLPDRPFVVAHYALDLRLDFATSRLEVRATVPSPMEAFANGVLVESHEAKGTRTFHWKMDKAIPPYLATLVVGEFSKLEDTWEDVPLRFLVPKGREEEGKLSFAPTRA